MPKIKRFFAVLLAFFLSLAALSAPVHAGGIARDAADSSGGAQTGSLPLPWEAKAAVDWIHAQLPEPGVGDELAVFALLRSGQNAAKDAYISPYTESLIAHITDVGIEGQDLQTTAWQVLVLSAAGTDVTANAQPLLDALSDAEALNDANQETLALVLLALGPTGAGASANVDTLQLAQSLANGRNLDGGFGAEGVSDAISTARILQALAFYRHDGTVENGVVDGREWLRDNLAEYGGYDMEGSPSAVATAEAVIALCCLSEEGFDTDFPDPSNALTVFQNDDGSFSQNPDSPPDLDLTALGLLAIVSHTRLERGLAPVYRMSDVTVVPEAADENDDVSGFSLPRLGNLPPLSNTVLVLILVGTVALIVLLAVLMSSGRDMHRRRKKRRRRAKKVHAARERRRAAKEEADEASEGSASQAPQAQPNQPQSQQGFDVSSIPMDYIGEDDPPSTSGEGR